MKKWRRGKGTMLTVGSKTSRHARHGGGDEMVEIAIGGGGEFEGSEANVVESLVVDAVGLVGVLDELMDGQGGVVRLHDRIGHLWRGYDGESVHDSVGVFLSDLGNEERAHSTSGTTTQRMRQLESLKAVARLGLFTDDVEDRVDQLGAFGVMSLGPVVSGA